MDSNRTANTSTNAQLSYVDSQSVFEKFQRNEEIIQKQKENIRLVELSNFDPFEYFIELCNKLEETENIIEKLNYIIHEEPQIRIRQQIENVKQNIQKQGKRIPNHIDLYLEEKYKFENDRRKNLFPVQLQRTYSQKRYLKEKNENKQQELRVQKVQDFLQEQEIYDCFGKDKYFYNDKIKVPLQFLYKSYDKNKYYGIQESDELFAVRSVKSDPFLEMVDSDINIYKNYLMNKQSQMYTIQVSPPVTKNLQNNIYSLQNLPQINTQRSSLKLLTTDSQDDFQQQIYLLQSRLEKTQSKCDSLIKEYFLKLKEPSEQNIQNNQNLLDIREDLSNYDLSSSDQSNISTRKRANDMSPNNLIKKLREKQELDELKKKQKDGWIEDENQILYAYDANDSSMIDQNNMVFQKLITNYSLIECEFYVFESQKRQKKEKEKNFKKRIKRLRSILFKNMNICYIFERVFTLAALDLVSTLFPFQEIVYPLFNCNYDKNVLPQIINKINNMKSKVQQIPLYLKQISEKEIETDEDKNKQNEKEKPFIIVWKANKKNKKKPIMKQQQTDSSLKFQERLFTKSLPEIRQIGNVKQQKIIKIEKIIEENEINENNQNFMDQEEYQFQNLQQCFYEMYSVRSSSRSQIENQTPIESLQEIFLDYEQRQLTFAHTTDKKLTFQSNTLNFMNKQIRSKQQTKVIQYTKSNDQQIQQLLKQINILNLPKIEQPTAKDKQKIKKMNTIETNKAIRQSYFKKLDDDVVKAASVFKRSGNKDKFKFRWLELRCFTLIWFDSAPQLTKDGFDAQVITQNKPNGYGEIQLELVEDTIIAKKHCFSVKLPTRNLTIEYDNTRVGLMWSKTIRNVVALKAYLHYLIIYGGKGKLFSYFNNLNIKELNLSDRELVSQDTTKINVSLEFKLMQLIYDSITSHQKLQIINLKNSGLSSISLKELFKYLSQPTKKTRISKIDISQNEIDSETIRQLCMYLKNENCYSLQHLIIDDCNLKDEKFSIILDAIKQRYKWQMTVYENTQRNNVLPTEQLFRQVSVRYSNISNNNSPRGEKVYFFQTLSFANNQITDQGLQIFMRTIEEIWTHSIPYIKQQIKTQLIILIKYYYYQQLRDEEEFESICLNLSQNKFINELSNFGAFIQTRQIFIRIYLDNLINTSPDQIASFILSFQYNYRLETLSLRGNLLSLKGFENLIKLLDDNYTLQEINVNFSNYHEFQSTFNQEKQQINNLRSQYFSFSHLTNNSNIK